MSLNNFAVPHYRINRSSAKISELPSVSIIDNGAKFIIAHNDQNYSVTGATLITVIASAVIALGGGGGGGSGGATFDPLLLPISNATQTALNGKANISHTHEISQINGLATYVTDAINLAIAGLTYSTPAHAHSISDVTNLQSTLNAKALASDIPPIVQAIANMQSSKADATVVTQIQNSISGLLTTINAKASQSDLSSLSAVVTSLITTVGGKANTTHGHAISDVTGLTAELAQYSTAISNLSTRIGTVEGNYVISGASQW